jgi:CRP-like cAMP-binding protein
VTQFGAEKNYSMNHKPANRILAGLPESELARLLPLLKPVTLSAGEEVSDGTAGQFIYFPETAVISSISAMEDGKSTEVGMIGFEGVADVTSLLGKDRNGHFLNVSIAGRALKASADDVAREMSARNALQPRLLEYTATYVAQISQRSACGVLHQLEQRFAIWLLLLSDRLPDEVIQITHERIAERLGVRRAGVTVVAANMKAAGIISYSRGSLRILDRGKLEDLACECYDTLALRYLE